MSATGPTRTDMPLRAQAPQACASANSATVARGVSRWSPLGTTSLLTIMRLFCCRSLHSLAPQASARHENHIDLLQLRSGKCRGVAPFGTVLGRTTAI